MDSLPHSPSRISLPARKMIRSWKRIGINTSGALLLCSCALPDYPASWSRLQTEETTRSCPMIAGLYVDEGIQSNNPGDLTPGPCDLSWNCLLSNYLYFKRIPRLESDLKRTIFPGRRPTHVEIVQPSDDVLEVVAWNGTGSTREKLPSARLTRERGDFSCSPEGLKLRRLHGGAEFRFFGGGSEWEDRILTRSEDGQLVLKRDFRVVGVAFIVPFVAFGTSWYRWKPVPANTPVN